MSKNFEILKLNGVSKSVLRNKAKSLSVSNASKEKNSKKYKSLTDASFSNTSALHKYFIMQVKSVSDEKDILDVVVVPMKSKLYQGTDFEFNQNDDEETKIKKYFNYYDKRHNKSYFLGSDKVASMYGKNLDFSNVIYTTIPDYEDIKDTKCVYKYIYPLYYVGKPRGSNIIYALKDNVKLMNIGDLNTLKILWNIIHESKELSDNDKQDYIETLKYVCLYDNEGELNKKYPIRSFRKSYDMYDDEFVEILKKFMIDKLYEKYNIKIDGWIYYTIPNNPFHDEILLFDKSKIYIKDIKTYSPSFYKDIPSRNEFMKLMENKRMKNYKGIKYNTILSNICNVRHE